MSGLVCLLVVSLALPACSGAPGTGATSSTSPSSTVSPSASASASVDPGPPPPFVPAPGERVPRRAGPLAARLELVTASLHDSIEAWIESGTVATHRPPRLVILQGLYQQRIYRLLARRPRLAGRVLRRVAPELRQEATANVRAGAKLRSLVTPLEPPIEVRTGPAEPAGRLLRYFRKAERRFRVEWEILAAVNYVETKFNRVRSRSSAGAQGPMQFLPSTWEAYGLGGDIHDPSDAIMGAANYLRASGAPGDYRAALYAYNHSDAYVDAVLLYARQMERRPASYYAYYSWQVFVITTKGDVRLTGPGVQR